MHMNTRTVSVVIPVKDDAVLLRRCLGALAAQTQPPVEIIVVDNGSADESAQVAADAGAQVVSQLTGTIPAAAATGLDAASGDILARLDADCVAPPDWIETIASAMGDASGITGGADFIDGPRPLRTPLAFIYLGAYFASVLPALGHLPLFGSNFAVTREAWRAVRRDVHRQDDMVHDDLDLSFHLGPQRRIRFVRAMSMGMSMRPFYDVRAFWTRFRRGIHTVVVHWPDDLPWRRWARRVRMNG